MLEGAAVVVLGRPGSGKGTQGRRLAKRFGLAYVDLGRAIRAEAKPATRRAEIIRRVEPGGYVPKALSEEILLEEIAKEAVPGQGLVLDGYPRFDWQVDRLRELINPMTVVAAIHLNLDVEAAFTRLALRLSCSECGETVDTDGPAELLRCALCGGPAVKRPDDDVQALRRRLQVAETELGAVLAFYDDTGILVRCDAKGTRNAVEGRIVAAVKQLLSPEASGSEVEQMHLFGNDQGLTP